MKYIFLSCCLIFMACSGSTLQKELDYTRAVLEETKSSLETTQQTLAELKAEESGQLVHVVFFKLKPDADINTLIAEVKKLEEIEVVKDLEVGPFTDLGDTRALAEFSMAMEMAFDDVASYKKYQEHPIHLALKTKAKKFLAGPPVTYDYMKK